MELYKVISASIIFICSIIMFIVAYSNKTNHENFGVIASLLGGTATFFCSIFIITNYRNDYIFYLILAATIIVIAISAIFEIRKNNKKRSS